MRTQTLRRRRGIMYGGLFNNCGLCHCPDDFSLNSTFITVTDNDLNPGPDPESASFRVQSSGTGTDCTVDLTLPWWSTTPHTGYSTAPGFNKCIAYEYRGPTPGSGLWARLVLAPFYTQGQLICLFGAGTTRWALHFENAHTSGARCDDSVRRWESGNITQCSGWAGFSLAISRIDPGP